MSNLDKSLGEIISSRKTATRGRRTGRRGGAKGPVGGITKNSAPTKPSARPAKETLRPTAPAANGGGRKIMVSALPTDLTEQDIKKFFAARIGPISKIELSYGPNGTSRGVCTIIFRQDLAQKAVSELDGLEVDKRPMRVEALFDAAHLPGGPVAPKSLNDRVAAPKKETAATGAGGRKDKPKKVEAGAKGGRGGATAGGKRGRNSGRPKKKTAEELDAEMTDYFGASGGTGAPATDADAPMAAAPAAVETAPASNEMDEVL